MMAMTMNKHSLPPLPSIQGELMLDVYTHRSMLSKEVDESTPHGNTERLAELGNSVLSMIVMYTLFSEKPMLPAHDLKMRKSNTLSDKNIADWLSLYGLKAKIRCTDRSVLEKPEEARFLFNSYVGAVYTQKGLQVVTNWIGRLVNPALEPPPVPGETSNNQRAATPPPPPPTYYAQP
ncbi:Ribonuclease 3, partial [Rhizopogon vesiculosus]